MKTTEKITPFLWFDPEHSGAEEASEFYVSIFRNSKIGGKTHYSKESATASGNNEGDVMTVSFELENQTFTALNGGPNFKFNPSISFFINCETETEIAHYWKKLSAGGKVLMPLEKYDFSEKYGWVEDKFGVSWQVILSKPEGLPAEASSKAGEWRPKIIPCLLFSQEKSGKTKEAVEFYVSLFARSKIGMIAPNEKPGTEGTTAYADFTLENQWFAAMDNPQEAEFEFNEAISFVVNCENQEEIDYFWNKFTKNGGQESRCGWLKDKFGVSWQIVPKNIGELIKSKEAVQALMQMKKLEIEKLKNA